MNLQPNDFWLEPTTVWSFPTRGSWATHTGSYRGNWSPYVPRNLILRYSNPGDWILDQFMGSGTTMVEAKLLNRNAYGIDINSHAVSIAKENFPFRCNTKTDMRTKIGDASNLNVIRDKSYHGQPGNWPSLQETFTGLFRHRNQAGNRREQSCRKKPCRQKVFVQYNHRCRQPFRTDIKRDGDTSCKRRQ